MTESYDAVIVVSFGGPEGPDDVLPFLENVTRGRNVPPERLQVVAEQYERFGGVSPINAQNRALVAAVDAELVRAGHSLPVYWGNRNWHPYLADTVRQMRDDGVERALAFVTSGYSSYSSCRQYLENIEARAPRPLARERRVIDKLRQFYDHPGYVGPFARNLAASRSTTLPADVRAVAHIAFTAHSIPTRHGRDVRLRRAAARDRAPGRRARQRPITRTRSCTRVAAAHRPSRGSNPTSAPTSRRSWRSTCPRWSSSPIGFISDHMEVVYDLDVLAAGRAAGAGVAFSRAATPGTDPEFVAMIRELIDERLDPSQPRATLGTLGLRPDVCPGCCR